jgi:hypothetical protein
MVGVCWVAVECLSATQYVIYELTLRWLLSLSIAVAVLERSGVAMIWLGCYPPAAYRRWINRDGTPHARVA